MEYVSFVLLSILGRSIFARFRSARALGEERLLAQAPLAAEVQMFVQTVFNCVVRQGYGLTETCAATCIALAQDNMTLNVGPPQESACIKLRDWEEGNYKNSDLEDKDIQLIVDRLSTRRPAPGSRF